MFGQLRGIKLEDIAKSSLEDFFNATFHKLGELDALVNDYDGQVEERSSHWAIEDDASLNPAGLPASFRILPRHLNIFMVRCLYLLE